MNYEIVNKTYLPQTDSNMYLEQVDILNILSRTTHLCVAAHYDDVEIMAFNGICNCFKSDNKFFTAVIVTDGLGGEKNGIYKNFTDEEFINTRKEEQKKASVLGEYNAVIFLEYPSSKAKDKHFQPLEDNLNAIINLTKPDIIYTHSPFDTHKTHVAVVSRLINVLCNLKDNYVCAKLFGCEVWGSLDWLPTNRKICLDVSQNTHLQTSLIDVFDSQISRGKDFSNATLGRRKANATFYHSLKEDSYQGVTLSILLNEIINQNMTIEKFIDNVIVDFTLETKARLFSMDK